MGLVDYKDDAPESDDDMHGEGEGDDCVSCAHDMIEAMKTGDAEAFSSALKQFLHYESKEGSDMPEEDSGKGLLAIIGGKPKK